MRKLLLALGLVAAVLTAFYPPAPAAASSEKCSTTCSPSGAVLNCMVANGSCSSTNTSVTCCGQTHSCTPNNDWWDCIEACIHGSAACTGKTCPDIQQGCIQGCGSAPPTNFSC